MKKLWEKAKRSWTVYSTTIIAILGIIQINIGAFNLTPQQQGWAFIGIGIIVTMARLRPKKDSVAGLK